MASDTKRIMRQIKADIEENRELYVAVGRVGNDE